MQAFTLRVRPALDSLEAALDRLKVRTYAVCAKYGLPCPVTGHQASSHSSEGAQHGAEQQGA